MWMHLGVGVVVWEGEGNSISCCISEHAVHQLMQCGVCFVVGLIPCPAAVLLLLLSCPCCAASLLLLSCVAQGLTYDKAQAAINGTVSIQLPKWLEVLLHHSNHHLPSHLSLSIPSYNLPAAQVRLLLGSVRLCGLKLQFLCRRLSTRAQPGCVAWTGVSFEQVFAFQTSLHQGLTRLCGWHRQSLLRQKTSCLKRNCLCQPHSAVQRLLLSLLQDAGTKASLNADGTVANTEPYGT